MPKSVAPQRTNRFIKSRFPGMPKRRMPRIMSQRNRLRQIFVQTQSTADCPRDLGDLERMG